jgi:hypothetical protein
MAHLKISSNEKTLTHITAVRLKVEQNQLVAGIG